MIAYQITNEGKIEKIQRSEQLVDLNSVKVKIDKALLTYDDIATVCQKDDSVNYPVIPTSVALGKLVDESKLSDPSLTKFQRVFLSSTKNCNNCYNCLNGVPDKCYNFQVAGKNIDGYLRDFTVADKQVAHLLPESIKDEDAIYIERISLALSIVDNLKIKKGQHVAIVGGGVFGSILGQILIYYQSVPIFIDNNEQILSLAKKAGIYYILNYNEDTQKEVSLITGGRFVSKVVYLSNSTIPMDVAYDISAQNANVGIVGNTYTPLLSSLIVGLKKQLTLNFMLSSFNNIEPAINLLANKAIDLSIYKLKTIAFADVQTAIEQEAQKFMQNKFNEDILIKL